MIIIFFLIVLHGIGNWTVSALFSADYSATKILHAMHTLKKPVKDTLFHKIQLQELYVKIL